jgi:hypothetical protein
MKIQNDEIFGLDETNGLLRITTTTGRNTNKKSGSIKSTYEVYFSSEQQVSKPLFTAAASFNA